ncbi:MAG: hypothetical protein HEEMFOPI_01327 [Holosporales bacterium]
MILKFCLFLMLSIGMGSVGLTSAYAADVPLEDLDEDDNVEKKDK